MLEQSVEQNAQPVRTALSAKQSRFVAEYLLDLNVTQSAIRAGYSAKHADSIGARLVRKSQVSRAIEQAIQTRSRRTEIHQDRVLQELAVIAFATVSDVLAWQGERLELRDPGPATPAIKQISARRTRRGARVSVTMHDKLQALKLLAQHLGLLRGQRTECASNGAAGSEARKSLVDHVLGLIESP
jgi:phage terminase small subunit